eukprot:Phypoly_transcript_08006.p1 GENE.Phypoly_transcript_08006~~Phypoly_transcript_08006.p1  ORF type:complete len:378 (-),score=37.53 Phypoly_transcript_08006:173-1306(-)
MKSSLNDDDATPLVVQGKVSHGTFLKEHLLPISVLIVYFVLSTLLPIYSKELSEYYDFPLSASTVQVAGALIALAIINVIVFFVQRHDLVPKSWIGNKNFFWKSLVTLPISIMFALVIALTNISIFNSPLDLHVLLKATNIVWVVIFAWIIEKEKPKVPVMICVVGLITGSVLISYQFSKNNTLKSPVKILLLNLFTFFCEAVMVVVLKKVVVVLQKREPTIRAHEITLTKLWQAFLLLLLPTYLVEGLKGMHALQAGGTVYWLVAAGIAITAVYQTTTVGLSFFSLATTLGVLGQITIVPQTILAMLLVKIKKSKNPFTFTALHIAGAVLVMLCSVAFGVVRYMENRKEYAKRRDFLLPKTTNAYGTNFEGVDEVD